MEAGGTFAGAAVRLYITHWIIDEWINNQCLIRQPLRQIFSVYRLFLSAVQGHHPLLLANFVVLSYRRCSLDSLWLTAFCGVLCSRLARWALSRSLVWAAAVVDWFPLIQPQRSLPARGRGLRPASFPPTSLPFKAEWNQDGPERSTQFSLISPFH